MLSLVMRLPYDVYAYTCTCAPIKFVYLLTIFGYCYIYNQEAESA